MIWFAVKEMTNCRLCNRNVLEGTHLSDGGMIHESCLDLLQDEARKAEEELGELQKNISRLEHELSKREGIGFKIISIFLKPDVELGDIREEIAVVRNNIAHAANELSAICSKLTSLYDYFLTYPPDWDERRKKIISRGGEQCSECGRWRHLHMHHITPLSRGGSDKTSNLRLLCEDCHSRKHGGRDFTSDFGKSETAYSKRVSSIRYAVKHGKRVEFGYRKPGEKGYKKRTIEPIELVSFPHRRGSGATLCVLGFCELRKANRNFALKRMRGLKIV